MLAQYAGDPLVVPDLVVEGLMLAGLLGLALVPETVTRSGGPPPVPAAAGVGARGAPPGVLCVLGFAVLLVAVVTLVSRRLLRV